MNTKLLNAIKEIVDKSSIGTLPQGYSGEVVLKIFVHEGGVRGAKENIETTIKK